MFFSPFAPGKRGDPLFHCSLRSRCRPECDPAPVHQMSLHEDGEAPCKVHWTGKDLGDGNCDTAVLKEFLETSFIVTCCSSQLPPSVAFTGSSGQLFLVSLQLRNNRWVKLSIVVCRLQSLQVNVKNAKKKEMNLVLHFCLNSSPGFTRLLALRGATPPLYYLAPASALPPGPTALRCLVEDVRMSNAAEGT